MSEQGMRETVLMTEVETLRESVGLFTIEIVALREGLDNAFATNKALIDALEELVAVKNIKEQFGKTPAYENRRDFAWKAATRALKAAKAEESR